MNRFFLESEASSADAGTDTELSTPTTLHRRGLRKIVEDTPSPAVSRGSRKGRKPVTSESSGVSSPERRGGKVPETPEKVIRGRPLVPGSPGVSRSGRRNSPRIDYRLIILDIFYNVIFHSILKNSAPMENLINFQILSKDSLFNKTVLSLIFILFHSLGIY